MIKGIFCFCLFFCSVFLHSVESFAAVYPDGEVTENIRKAMYQGGETLKYKISWTGGIKIGELRMEITKVADKENVFELRARVKDSGLFHFFYPVDDSFVTLVQGQNRLPFSYEVIQKEGENYNARRYTEYEQDIGEVRYQKNEKTPELYSIDGAVHNEFSSFFFTRMMRLESAHPAIVPTFVDGARHEVVVRTGVETRIRDTVRGDVNVIPVTPVMKFKGLYDKDGATVIWLTNDECRIPVRISSKVLIGSLTAELVSYSNPYCGDQNAYHKKIPDSLIKEQELELGD